MSVKNLAPIRFIVIDDDPISNLLCQISIKKYYDDAKIFTFTQPDIGFAFIVSEFSTAVSQQPVILFLDINMPIWSGWDFLDFFEKLDSHFKNLFKIYIMSSSIDGSDKLRAENNKNVIDYIVKPCTKKCLLEIFEQLDD